MSERVPEGWEVTSLGDLTTLITKGTTPKSYSNGGVNFIKVESVSSSGNLLPKKFSKIDLDTHENQKRSQLKCGDILFAIAGSLGRLAIVKNADIPANTNQALAIIRLKQNSINEKFCFYQLGAEIIQSEIKKLQTVGAQPNLSLQQVSDLIISIPPLPEQLKIAEILRTWDEAIEKLEALRAGKERRHRALTHSLVFGSRQLDHFRTTDEVTPQRWFKLPTSWECKPIGKLAKEITERNAEGEQHEVLSCSKHDGFVRSLEYFKKQVFSADLSSYKKIWCGDFGFPSNHIEEGSIGLQNLTNVGVVSPIYTIFRFAQETVNADYAFSVLKTEIYRHIFEVSTSASVDRRGSLRWKEFSKLPFPLPSLREQEAIADVLLTAKADLDGLNIEIEALTRQKRGLMQKLLTGEWRMAESND